jgi:hypothetical protein
LQYVFPLAAGTALKIKLQSDAGPISGRGQSCPVEEMYRVEYMYLPVAKGHTL